MTIEEAKKYIEKGIDRGTLNKKYFKRIEDGYWVWDSTWSDEYLIKFAENSIEREKKLSPSERATRDINRIARQLGM